MDNLQSLILYWDHLALELDISKRDRVVFRRRAENEGLKFLTTTLPAYGKELEKHLVEGVDPDFSDIRFKRGRDGETPLFLGCLLRKCLNGPHSVRATNIKKFRQLTCLFYKLEVPHESNTLDLCYNRFIEVDSSLGSPNEKEETIEKARRLISRLLCNCNPLTIVPQHGPGATACRTKNPDKWHKFRFIPKLDAVYPYDSHFFYNLHHVSEQLEDLMNAEVVEEPHSRLVCVPKDSRGPRLICCEPMEFQYIQQGLMRKLYSLVESHPLTKGFVNFTDQTINQRLACQASLDESLATIDLKDASDRVSDELVKKLFPQSWYNAMQACRSRYVDLPDGRTYGPQRKFAPMGSALCFPIEALCFWALIKAETNSDVWVYGDDIIVPIGHVDKGIKVLESSELKVNVDKSCYRTPFRESCGGDYYAGIDISYVKFRQIVKNDSLSSRQHDISFAELVAQCWGIRAGLAVLDVVDSIHGITPVSNSVRLPFVFYHEYVRTSRNCMFRRRFNKNLHHVEHQIPSARIRPSHARTDTAFHRNEMLRLCILRGDARDIVRCLESEMDPVLQYYKRAHRNDGTMPPLGVNGEVGVYQIKAPSNCWKWVEL